MICPFCFVEIAYSCNNHLTRGSQHRFIYRSKNSWFLSIYYDAEMNDVIEIGHEDHIENGLNYDYFIYIDNGVSATSETSFEVQPFEMCNVLQVLNQFLKLKAFS